MGEHARQRLQRLIRYQPLASQRKFHRSKAPFKGFSGPVGSGKSAALVQEAIRLSYVNAGRTGLIGAPTYPMLRDATQTAMLDALAISKLPFELNKSEQCLVMKDTGSRILFRSLEEFERLRGTNLAWFGVDELTYCHEDAWLRLEARLRDPLATERAGFAVWTPKGFDWVYRKFIGSPAEGYEVVQARPMENSFLLQAVPDFYERLKRSYDPRFYEQEVLGQYLNVQSGQAYYAFQRKDHVMPVEIMPNRPLHWALDFNVNPMTSIVAQVIGKTVYVVDEIVLHQATTWDAADTFLDRFNRHPTGLIVYGDAAGHHSQRSGWTDYEMLRERLNDRGWTRVQENTKRSNPPVRTRVGLVNSLLRSADGETRMLIDPKCKELIKDLEQVVFVEGRGELDKNRDWKRTHASDALGYLLCSAFADRKVEGRKKGRIV